MAISPQSLTPFEKEQQIEKAQAFLDLLINTPAVMHCLKCGNMTPEGYCDVFSQKPPPEFYEQDCEHFDEEIPF